MGIMAAREKENPPEIVVPDSPAELVTLKFARLDGVSALNRCDRHFDVYAVVEVTRADWKSSMLFCGNCARKHFGYEHTAHAVQENRQKGSSS